jgi:hypothetical protein
MRGFANANWPFRMISRSFRAKLVAAIYLNLKPL